MDRDELKRKIAEAIGDANGESSEYYDSAAAEAVFDVIEKAGLEIVKKQVPVLPQGANAFCNKCGWFGKVDPGLNLILHPHPANNSACSYSAGYLYQADAEQRPIEERSDTATAGNADVSLTQKNPPASPEAK